GRALREGPYRGAGQLEQRRARGPLRRERAARTADRLRRDRGHEEARRGEGERREAAQVPLPGGAAGGERRERRRVAVDELELERGAEVGRGLGRGGQGVRRLCAREAASIREELGHAGGEPQRAQREGRGEPVRLAALARVEVGEIERGERLTERVAELGELGARRREVAPGVLV